MQIPATYATFNPSDFTEKLKNISLETVKCKIEALVKEPVRITSPFSSDVDLSELLEKGISFSQIKGTYILQMI